MKDIKYYNNTDFAARMRLLMSARNVKLKDIADATSCSVSAVSTWKRGRLPRSYKTISKLARPRGKRRVSHKRTERVRCFRQRIRFFGKGEGEPRGVLRARGGA